MERTYSASLVRCLMINQISNHVIITSKTFLSTLLFIIHIGYHLKFSFFSIICKITNLLFQLLLQGIFTKDHVLESVH